MYDFRYLGWMYEKSGDKVSHDKLWGVINVSGELITFWGRRDRKLTFKRPPEGDIDALIRQKKRKGYREVAIDVITAQTPEFLERFDSELVMSLMANRFHGV